MNSQFTIRVYLLKRMAPRDFPTFETRKEYWNTESLEPLFVIAAVVSVAIVLLVIIGISYAVLHASIYLCKRLCKIFTGDDETENPQRQNAAGEGETTNEQQNAAGEGETADEQQNAAGEGETADEQQNAAGEQETANEQQNAAGERETADEQQNAAGEGETADEQQNAAGERETADEQQNAAGEGETADEQQNAAGEQETANEQQNAAGERETADEQQNAAGERETADEQQNAAGEGETADEQQNAAGEQETANEQRENATGDGNTQCCTKMKCCRDAGCSFLHSVLSSVFNMIEIAEDTEGKTNILMFSKRLRPKSLCCYGYVVAYFLFLLVLLSALFLCMFSNFFIYRKTSTCNDINVKTEYSICFDINNGYERVTCTDSEKINDPNLEVICYLTDANFFRALGVAFGAIQAIRFLIVIFFPVGITMGLKWPQLTIATQCSGALVSTFPPTILYSLFYKRVTSQYLYGDPLLVHFTLWLACATGFVFFVMHPWWAFHGQDKVFKQIIDEDGESHEKYLKWKHT